MSGGWDFKRGRMAMSGGGRESAGFELGSMACEVEREIVLAIKWWHIKAPTGPQSRHLKVPIIRNIAILTVQRPSWLLRGSRSTANNAF